MLANKDILRACEVLEKHNPKITEIYETKRGTVQMEAYGKANVWSAFLKMHDLPILEITPDSMNGEPYVIIVFGYPEDDSNDSDYNG